MDQCSRGSCPGRRRLEARPLDVVQKPGHVRQNSNRFSEVDTPSQLAADRLANSRPTLSSVGSRQVVSWKSYCRNDEWPATISWPDGARRGWEEFNTTAPAPTQLLITSNRRETALLAGRQVACVFWALADNCCLTVISSEQACSFFALMALATFTSINLPLANIAINVCSIRCKKFSFSPL